MVSPIGVMRVTPSAVTLRTDVVTLFDTETVTRGALVVMASGSTSSSEVVEAAVEAVEAAVEAVTDAAVEAA